MSPNNDIVMPPKIHTEMISEVQPAMLIPLIR